MKKWWMMSMLVALACLLTLTVSATPEASVSPVVAPEAAPAPQADGENAPKSEAPSLGLAGDVAAELETSRSGGVTCTFTCNDGIGYVYDCPDPSLGTCCAQAEPACASNGGLDTGICRKGRLGLICNPDL